MGRKDQGGFYQHDAVEVLRTEYGQRRARNAHYSLRAFAKHLAMGSGPLSEVLLRKRALTLKQGARIAQRLGYSASEKEQFFHAIESTSKKQIKKQACGAVFSELDVDAFHMVSEWYHYAIRELIETPDFRDDPRWIAKRLGISTTEVKSAIDRLSRLGAIERKADRWVASISVTTSHDVPSKALRKFHEQSLQKAVSALNEVAVELRDVTAITMAIDPSTLPEAKKRIKAFRREMAALLERGRRTEVYQLNIQLIPLTQKEESHD